MLKNIVWFTERQIGEISLGGLIILILIRTIQYNMTRMRVRPVRFLNELFEEIRMTLLPSSVVLTLRDELIDCYIREGATSNFLDSIYLTSFRFKLKTGLFQLAYGLIFWYSLTSDFSWTSAIVYDF